MTSGFCSKNPAKCDVNNCYVPALPVCVRIGKSRCAGGSSVIMNKVPSSNAPRLRNADSSNPSLLAKNYCPFDQTETFCLDSEWEAPSFTGFL